MSGHGPIIFSEIATWHSLSLSIPFFLFAMIPHCVNVVNYVLKDWDRSYFTLATELSFFFVSLFQFCWGLYCPNFTVNRWFSHNAALYIQGESRYMPPIWARNSVFAVSLTWRELLSWNFTNVFSWSVEQLGKVSAQKPSSSNILLT